MIGLPVYQDSQGHRSSPLLHACTVVGESPEAAATCRTEPCSRAAMTACFSLARLAACSRSWAVTARSSRFATSGGRAFGGRGDTRASVPDAVTESVGISRLYHLRLRNRQGNVSLMTGHARDRLHDDGRPSTRVLAAYRREVGGVASWDHKHRPSRALAFAAARDDVARWIARDVAAGQPTLASWVDEFRLLEAILQRRDGRILARLRAKQAAKETTG